MAGEAEGTRDGLVVAAFGGEVRAFRLTVPFLAKLQDETGVGPGYMTAVLEQVGVGGPWKVEWVTRTLFWGLVGAGMAPNDAGALVRTHVEERGYRGLVENLALVYQVIVGGVRGPAEESLGESDAAAAGGRPPRSRRRRSPSGASASSSSTPTPPQPASDPTRSTAAASGR